MLVSSLTAKNPKMHTLLQRFVCRFWQNAQFLKKCAEICLKKASKATPKRKDAISRVFVKKEFVAMLG